MGVQQAVRSLAGFNRVELKPGETKHETIHVGPGSAKDGHGNVRAFQYWSTSKQAWETAPGDRAVWVGTSSAEADLRRATASGSTTPSACAAAAGFRSVTVGRHGRGLRLAFSRRVGQPVTVDVFQQSVGRRIVSVRRVAHFTGRTRTFNWSGRPVGSRLRSLHDGYYFARYRIAVPSGVADYRRVALRRFHGRFSLRPAFYGRGECALVRSFKLSAPVFGGSNRRPLGIAFRTSSAARVTVVVLRGRRVARRFGPRSVSKRRIYRLTLKAAGRAHGDYVIRITARSGTAGATRVLTSRLLERRSRGGKR